MPRSRTHRRWRARCLSSAYVDADPTAFGATDLDLLVEKEVVLAAAHRGFFTIPHFDGYAAILIELRRAGRRALRQSRLLRGEPRRG